MVTRIDPAERLMQLAIALLNTRHGMTKREVKARVTGYDPDAAAEAFDRMFERDKSQLRVLGLDVETMGLDGHGEDVRYRIAVATDADYTGWFTPAQLTALGIAARLWHTAAPQRDITLALIRLRALGLDLALDPATFGEGVLPNTIAMHAAQTGAVEAIADARAFQRRVKFEYRAASHGTVGIRTVEPWRIAVRPTGWYLIGRDVDKDAPRVFHLDRIEGAVRLFGREGAFELPAESEVAAAGGYLDRSAQAHATLAIRPGRAAALRARAVAPVDELPAETGGDEARGEGADDILTVAYAHDDVFAREIVRYGSDVRVIEPAALVRRTLDLLRAGELLGAGERA